MDKKAFDEAYKYIIGKEPNSMVESQVLKLVFQHSYQEIFNAIWYFYEYKGVDKQSIDIYGVGLIRDTKNMEEALGYFKQLAEVRRRAAISAESFKSKEIKIKKVKRQKQKVYREEYDWDE